MVENPSSVFQEESNGNRPNHEAYMGGGCLRGERADYPFQELQHMDERADEAVVAGEEESGGGSMVELITSRITATVLWMPESWMKHGIVQKELETEIVHAVSEGRDEVRADEIGAACFFSLTKAPLESKPDSVRGMAEINSFTLDTMTRYYLRLSQIL